MFCKISKSTVLKSFRLWCPLDANTVKAFTVSNSHRRRPIPYIIWLSGEPLHCTNILLKYNGIYSKTCHFKLKFPEFSGRGIDSSPLGASIESPRECLATYRPDDWARLLCTMFTLIHWFIRAVAVDFAGRSDIRMNMFDHRPVSM